jgi:L-ascorbate metabolism protein UlaG (beta-lactamase superfamily)
VSLSATIVILLAAAAPAAGPTLQARFLGNAAFEISDGETTLLTDFPYRSGAFGYMEYDPSELRARPRSVCLITHAHADHFDASLVAKVGCRVVGPALPAAETVRLEGITIQPVKTGHAGAAHFSYLVE